jgi:hypothetical protein
MVLEGQLVRHIAIDAFLKGKRDGHLITDKEETQVKRARERERERQRETETETERQSEIDREIE